MENNGFIENPTDAHRQNSSEVGYYSNRPVLPSLANSKNTHFQRAFY